MIGGAGVQLRAMIYLGINCGFGNMDCATLPLKAIDLEKGWVDFGRPKTGVHRRCPLWAETVTALRAAIAMRYKPKDSALAGRVFVTKYKAGWEQKKHRDDPISKETAKLLKTLGFHRPGLGFYALRHTFETIGLKSRDREAVRAIMGHIPDGNDMSAVYNEEAPDDARLLAVVNYIHDWLCPAAPVAPPAAPVVTADVPIPTSAAPVAQAVGVRIGDRPRFPGAYPRQHLFGLDAELLGDCWRGQRLRVNRGPRQDWGVWGSCEDRGNVRCHAMQSQSVAETFLMLRIQRRSSADSARDQSQK